MDFGYDVSDYDNIDPMYGTLADFDRMDAEAKQRLTELQPCGVFIGEVTTASK